MNKITKMYQSATTYLKEKEVDLSDDEGASMVEYALLIGAVVALSAALVAGLGGVFTDVVEAIPDIGTPGPE